MCMCVCVSECECAITAWLLCVASCIHDPVSRMCEWDCVCVEESGACIDGLSFLWTCTVFFSLLLFVPSFAVLFFSVSFYRIHVLFTHNIITTYASSLPTFHYVDTSAFDNYIFIEWLAYHFILKENSATIIHDILVNILFSTIEIYDM